MLKELKVQIQVLKEPKDFKEDKEHKELKMEIQVLRAHKEIKVHKDL